MIRKFNYTGRRKIKRSSVRIDILRSGMGERSFNVSLTLEDLNLPPAAHVYVEAYHRSGYQRYDFGSVGNRKMPVDRRLDRFPDTVIPLFRVKVVDKSSTHGRILAALDKVRPETVEDIPSGSQSLLYVEYEDLGDSIWQLDLEGDWPVLKLNRRIDEIPLIASSDARFLALVYPEILRQVLRRIINDDEHTDPDCDDDWPSLWLKLACTLPGMSPLPAGLKGDQAEWIEKAVGAFCGNRGLLEKFNLAYQEKR